MPKLREIEYADEVQRIKDEADRVYDITEEELRQAVSLPSAADLDAVCEERRIKELNAMGFNIPEGATVTGIKVELNAPSPNS